MWNTHEQTFLLLLMLYRPTDTQRTTLENADEVSFQTACFIVDSKIMLYIDIDVAAYNFPIQHTTVA